MGEIEFEDWMNESDALMWHMERDPVLRVSGRVILGPAQLARMLWWV